MAGHGEALGIPRVVAWLTSTSECPLNFAYVDSGRISAAAAPSSRDHIKGRLVSNPDFVDFI